MAHGSSTQGFHEFKYGDFTDKVEIGDGDYGVVYAARHRMFNKVAIRIISRQHHVSEGERNSLITEAKKLSSIVSGNVIRLLGTVIEPGHLCLVFEYAEYGSLTKLLQRYDIPWPLKTRISHEVAMGMCFLHQKDILHLLLKCTNILVTGNVQVKITDIGLSGNIEMNNWTRCGRIYSQTLRSTQRRSGGSSISHVPPELIRDVNAAADKSADVYAYSIVLWQILTNKIPYEGKDTGAICVGVLEGERPDISIISREHPEVLSDAMKKCWQDEKQNRPTFEDLVRRIGPVSANCEDASRKAALECQKNVQDFYFPDSEIAAPTGDQQPARHHHRRLDAPSHIGRANANDGVAVPMQRNDDTVPFQNSASSQPKPVMVSLIVPVTDPQMELSRSVSVPPPDNKAPPIAPNPTLSEEKYSKFVGVDELYLVAEELGRHWRRFGLYLGFSDAQLDNIEANFHKHGFPEITYQMLRRWKERNGNVTVGFLFNTLRDADLLHVAQKLA
ncbi:receptor-interacting serine/threonine-protein kinase 1-like [Styela clava]